MEIKKFFNHYYIFAIFTLFLGQSKVLLQQMKIKTFLFSCLAFVYYAYSQNPQWSSYTDGNAVSAIAIEGKSVWVGFEYTVLGYLENPAGSIRY
ncbi:hypothetical protein JW935_21195 [candidate division KSB1 bacterium]|nr:hypothetical protein [candidate division KSB1 bacterium]